MTHASSDRNGLGRPAGHCRRHSGSRSLPVPPLPNERLALFFRACDGCINQLAHWHREYLSGRLSDDECTVLDEHLIQCRRCENQWDALTGEYEDAQVESGEPELNESDRSASSDQEADEVDPEFVGVSASRHRVAEPTLWSDRANRPGEVLRK